MTCRPIIVVLLALPGIAAAAPPMQSAEECAVAADMAIVARSLAEEDVLRPKAATIMARIYSVAESQRGSALMSEIIDAAYRKTPETTGRAFAEELFLTCLESGGNLDLALGRRS